MQESRKRFWLDELPSLLEEHPETACYDAVYIDEAQDFDPLWAPALAGLLRDPEQSKLYCFGDPNQKIFENSLDNDFEGFTLFELRENCRNTREIAEILNEYKNLPPSLPFTPADGKMKQNTLTG